MVVHKIKGFLALHKSGVICCFIWHQIKFDILDQILFLVLCYFSTISNNFYFKNKLDNLIASPSHTPLSIVTTQHRSYIEIWLLKMRKTCILLLNVVLCWTQGFLASVPFFLSSQHCLGFQLPSFLSCWGQIDKYCKLLTCGLWFVAICYTINFGYNIGTRMNFWYTVQQL